MIALMVWVLPSAGCGGLFVIVLMTYVIALGQFSHIVAGSTEAAFAVLTGAAGVGDYFVRFFLPTICGNMFGGVALAALAQSRACRARNRRQGPRSELSGDGGHGHVVCQGSRPVCDRPPATKSLRPIRLQEHLDPRRDRRLDLFVGSHGRPRRTAGA